MYNFSPEKLFAGREKALKNALELLEDSKVLFEAEKWARCFFIIQIATEELGKYGIIVTSTISAIHGSLDWKRFWKRFKDHKNKTRHILVLENFRRFLDDPLSELLNTEADIKYAEAQEYVKMQSLYCDVGDDGEFFAPSEIVTKRDCELSLQLLNNRVSLVTSFENKVAKKFPIVEMQKKDIDRFYKEIGISKIVPLGE